MPTAFFLSTLLHAAIVAAFLALAFAVHQRKPPPAMIFDLVAGPPTDLGATAAPALGSPTGDLEVKVPEPPAPRVKPAAPEPVVEETAPPPTRAEAVKPANRAETKPTARENAANRDAARLTYDQYVKQFGKPSTSRGATAGTSRPIAVPRIHSRGIAEGVVGGSASSKGGGGGTAMTAPEHSALDAYVSRLVAALRQNHEKPPGLSDLLSADVEFFIAADGTISHIRISHSSGNAAFDESCIAAFRRIGSIGPKPDGKSDTWELTFRMKDE
jgi:colicin import membrane protein